MLSFRVKYIGKSDKNLSISANNNGFGKNMVLLAKFDLGDLNRESLIFIDKNKILNYCTFIFDKN